MISILSKQTQQQTHSDLSTLKQQACFQTSKQWPLRQDCITLHHASLPRFTEKQAVNQKHNISEKKYKKKTVTENTQKIYKLETKSLHTILWHVKTWSWETININ